MRRCILPAIAFLLIFSVLKVPAQNINWNSSPRTGFVFQITNEEAQTLLAKATPNASIEELLHTQIDTFNVTDGWINRPDKGHFVLARIVENKLHCEYTSVFPYQVLLFKEYDALSLQVLDLEGNIRKDAMVRMKSKRIRFDEESSTYRLENAWFNGSNRIVTVELDGFRSIFNVEKHEVPTWSHDYYDYNDGPEFYSYMVTDRNKYKPGEILRFKSYALTGTRRPIRRDLDVWLISQAKSVKVNSVSPNRPGSFAGEFKLHDSLNLVLDRHYTLQLRQKDGRIVSNCTFRYEDYELYGDELHVTLQMEKHYFPKSNYVKILATSENGLQLKDARAKVVVLSQTIREVFQPLVILPDTLMSVELHLNPDDTTVVEIPSSLFQKANVAYSVHVSTLNSHNQRLERSIFSTYYYSQYELTADLVADSILFRAWDNGKEMDNVDLSLYRDDERDGTKVVFPHKEKINPATSYIKLLGPSFSRIIQMSNMLPHIEIDGGIRKDSLKISVNNPQKLLLSWFVYQGSTLMAKGSGSDVSFKSKIEDRTKSYYIEILYAFGGSDRLITREFVFQDGLLDITLNIPDRVYPGQKVDASIDVSDDEGNPVSNVDLTAFATTSKLKYYVPRLPYYGNISTARKENSSFSQRGINQRTAVLDLDYHRWSKVAGLDTMKYYQFTYPRDNGFRYEVDIADNTQAAIYVMKNGAAKQAYVIEVDRVPVYYSWTDNPKAYAFYVFPNRSTEVTVRLHDRVLILSGLCFEEGKKTILSFDLDNLPEEVIVKRLSPVYYGRKGKIKTWKFTTTEENRLRRYLSVFVGTKEVAYLVSDLQFVPVSTGNWLGRSLVVGPMFPGKTQYTVEQEYNIVYNHEGGYAYTFEGNVVYKKDAKDLYPDNLTDTYFRPMHYVNDVVYNKALLLQRPVYAQEKWHPAFIDLADPSCRVQLILPDESLKSGVMSVLFQDINSGTVTMPCRYGEFRPGYAVLPRGKWHVIVLYTNATYLRFENVDLNSNTKIAIDLRDSKLRMADSLSLKWLSSLPECFSLHKPEQRVLTLEAAHNIVGNVRGTILDEANMPLPGATVVVKGTTVGTTTDINGNFSLGVPRASALVISFIGYQTREIDLIPGSEITVEMQPDIQQLQEVVVVAFGTQLKQSLTASVSSVLQGRIAGVSVNSEDNDYEQEEVLSKEKQDEAERRLYEELLNIKTIRSNFSDVAFWEPRLFTDKFGKAAFTVVFPDDITRWDAVVLAMNTRLQTGIVRKSIKAYKPLMAELHLPQFVVAGDSADFVGRILNYTGDSTISGLAQWSGSENGERVEFASYHSEKRTIVALSKDSVKTSFSFTRDDGYFDGEERKISVEPQGTMRADGTLTTLGSNEVVSVHGKQNATMKVKIIHNQLTLYKQEVHALINYRYACNEQLASKLIGLLNHKLLMEFEEKQFRYDDDVNKIIQRLLKNQNDEFLWSWWDVSSNTSYWMSSHILIALKAAKDAGYKVNLDIENLVRKATYKYDFLNNLSMSDVSLLHALSMWNVNLNYEKYLEVLDRHLYKQDSIERIRSKNMKGYRPYSLLHEKLSLMEIRQLQGLPYEKDSLLRYKQETILKEVYFSDRRSSAYWYRSDLPINTIAYRIVKRDSTMSHMTTPMQMYFLSLRREREWNTYEASNVLMSILPDLIAEGASKKAQATVTISGKVNTSVTKFPFEIDLYEGDTINIKKNSGLPLFLMQYIEERVTKAQAGTDGFQIEAMLSNEKLKAGTPVMLNVKVNVKREAKLEHVMIEIPIPAGCSYGDKRIRSHAIETHREYFKEKTVIFCENMDEGTYEFKVPLLPRFTGKYHVNPAQISLMYFPVVNANTDMEEVRIVD